MVEDGLTRQDLGLAHNVAAFSEERGSNKHNEDVDVKWKFKCNDNELEYSQQKMNLNNKHQDPRQNKGDLTRDTEI